MRYHSNRRHTNPSETRKGDVVFSFDEFMAKLNDAAQEIEDDAEALIRKIRSQER